jgi:TolB-like protein
MLKRKNYMVGVLIVLSSLVGCTSMQVNHTAPVSMAPSTKVAVIPFTNMTETPQAEGRAAAISASLLRTKGYTVVAYPEKAGNIIPGVAPLTPKHQSLAWAREHHALYALTGTVTEWRYIVGLDGEPVVGVALELIRVKDGHTVWTSVGSKSDGSRVALSTTAQRLIDTMLVSLNDDNTRRT